MRRQNKFRVFFLYGFGEGDLGLKYIHSMRGGLNELSPDFPWRRFFGWPGHQLNTFGRLIAQVSIWAFLEAKVKVTR